MKKVTWGTPKIGAAKRPGSYGSFQEFFQKAEAYRKEQEEALEYLEKAMPAMVALLEFKLKHREPLIVMRPLSYMTSEIKKADEDDGFYRRSPNQSGTVKFEDVRKTIMPGTQLLLKSLDMGLQEFVFEDGMKNEHSINFSDRNLLMTQTDVFEQVRNYMNKGESK